MNPHARIPRRKMSSRARVIQMNMSEQQVHNLRWVNAALLKLNDEFGPSGRRA